MPKESPFAASPRRVLLPLNPSSRIDFLASSSADVVDAIYRMVNLGVDGSKRCWVERRKYRAKQRLCAR